ncbi:Orexin receptor type 2 [Halotydeus destructor]|nr:Orexin receptor type 2 [Halotydeus destructor]
MASELVDDKVGDMSAGQDVQLVRTLNDTVNEAKLVIERFRQSQFHFTEADVLILLGLYAILFVVGLAGNVFILTRLCRLNRKLISNKRYSSLFNPFLVNLCASDQLVLLSCCPLMAYSKATSFWHFGPMTCSGVHYVQALSVTSSTLSMAAISLQRFLVVKYPTSSGNKRFHARMNILLLLMVWVISLTTSLPVLFVRKQETITLVKSLDSTFTFCLEHWQSSDLRKAVLGAHFLDRLRDAIFHIALLSAECGLPYQGVREAGQDDHSAQ